MSVSLTVVLCQFELPSLLTLLVIVTCTDTDGHSTFVQVLYVMHLYPG